jgi:hypothetical protein
VYASPASHSGKATASKSSGGGQQTSSRSSSSTCCLRCGREGHLARSCYARNDVDGNYIRSDDEGSDESDEDSPPPASKGKGKRRSKGEGESKRPFWFYKKSKK